MKHFVFFAGALLPLTFAGGCSRTSDGSIRMPEPYLARTVVPGVRVVKWRRQELEPAPSVNSFPAPPAERLVEVEPERPAIVRRSRPPTRRATLVREAEQRSDPDRKVVCRDVTNSQGRFRVVCE